jgi:hypothetical protein
VRRMAFPPVIIAHGSGINVSAINGFSNGVGRWSVAYDVYCPNLLRIGHKAMLTTSRDSSRLKFVAAIDIQRRINRSDIMDAKGGKGSSVSMRSRRGCLDDWMTLPYPSDLIAFLIVPCRYTSVR